MSRISAGDRNALESLYHCYYHRLASFLSHSIGGRENVEEIINDTFIEVWRGAKDSREASLVASTWMFGTASRALPYLALSACLVIAVFGMIDPIEAWPRGRLPIEMIVLIGWAACGLLMAYAHDGRTRRAEGA